MNDEMLRIFLCEAASVVNSRPLTVSALNDVNSPKPLCPNDPLFMKCKPLLAPPGEFVRGDLFCRKRWRKLQYLISVFWKRFHSEYILLLQQRSKWCRPKRNLCVGDVVLLKDENLVRNHWQLGRVCKTHPSEDGLIRKVTLWMSTSNLDAKGVRRGKVSFLDRPVHKLVLLVEQSD